MAPRLCALLVAGLCLALPGCCSRCQSPYDYSGPVRSGVYPSGGFLDRAGSASPSDGAASLGPRPTPAPPPPPEEAGEATAPAETPESTGQYIEPGSP